MTKISGESPASCAAGSDEATTPPPAPTNTSPTSKNAAHHSATLQSPYSPFLAGSAKSTSQTDDLFVDPRLPSFTDVLILGAGPAGLTLSHELTKLGVDHIVIDHGRIEYPADPSPDLQASLPTQGILLQPSTLDTLNEIGIMDTLTLHGRPLQGASVILNDEVIESLERFPKCDETRFQSAIVLEQWRLERLLCDRLQFLQSTIFRHHVAFKLIIRVSSNSVTDSVSDTSSIEMDPAVRAAYKVKVFIRRMDPLNRRPVADSSGKWIRAKYVVGADGVRSMTRRALEIQMETLGPAYEYLVADVTISQWGHPLLQSSQSDGSVSVGNRSLPSENHLILIHNQSGSGVLIPYSTPGHWRVMMRREVTAVDPSPSATGTLKDVSFKKLQVPTQQDIRDIITQLVPGTSVQQVGWRTSYMVEPQVAETMYKERGVIIGDAARQDSPLWSAGVNCAIQDAVALGWRLAAVVNGGADESLLQTFSEERQKITRAQMNHSISHRDHLLNYLYVQHCYGASQIRKIIPLLNGGSPELQATLSSVAFFPPSVTRITSPIDLGISIASSRVLGFAANEESAPKALSLMQLTRDGSHVLLLMIRVLPLGTKHRSLFGCERKEAAPRYDKTDLDKLVIVAREVLIASGQSRPISDEDKAHSIVKQKRALSVKPVWVVCGLIDRSTMTSNTVLLTYSQLAKQVPLSLKSYILHGADLAVPSYSVIDHEYEVQDRSGLRLEEGFSWLGDMTKQFCAESASATSQTVGFIMMRPDGRVSVKGYPGRPEDRAALAEYTNHYFKSV